MINFYSKFKENKLTIFTAGFSVFTFLKDIEEVITHFFESLKYILFTFIILSIFLFYNFFKNNKINNNTGNLSEFKNLSKLNFISNFWIKISIFFCTSFVIIGFMSFLFLKNYPIYYVKVKDFKNEKNAIEYMGYLNKKFIDNNEYKIRARCLIKSNIPNKYPNGNYMITLNGGYLSKEKAEIKMKKAKKILGEEIKLTIPNPSKNISTRKKINYLLENN